MPPQPDPVPPSRPSSPRPPRTPTVQELALGLGETEPFHPLRRPPVAYLLVQDSGPNDGEWIRLRGDRFVIGRADGDLVIPHDPLMSARHAELSRQVHKGNHVWLLTDLQSTNGSFARINRAALEPGQEILLGGHRYRFDSPLDRSSTTATSGGSDDDENISTWRWSGSSTGGLAPYLIELTDQGEGKRHDLSLVEDWIGRDPRRCRVVLTDPMVDLQHARIHREQDGRWFIQDGKSLNGTWVRVTELRIKQAAQFQLGEQRFLLRLGQ